MNGSRPSQLQSLRPVRRVTVSGSLGRIGTHHALAPDIRHESDYCAPPRTHSRPPEAHPSSGVDSGAFDSTSPCGHRAHPWAVGSTPRGNIAYREASASSRRQLRPALALARQKESSNTFCIRTHPRWLTHLNPPTGVWSPTTQRPCSCRREEALAEASASFTPSPMLPSFDRLWSSTCRTLEHATSQDHCSDFNRLSTFKGMPTPAQGWTSPKRVKPGYPPPQDLRCDSRPRHLLHRTAEEPIMPSATRLVWQPRPLATRSGFMKSQAPP